MSETHSFPHDPRSVAAARRLVREELSDVKPDALDAIELMVSELATNCIRHAGVPFDLTVTHGQGEARVEVTDRAAGVPAMRSPTPDEPTGRGLQIVNMLSDSWGVEQKPSAGKTVWFRIVTATA